MNIPRAIVASILREYLPSGPFWGQPGAQQDAVERFIRASGSAFKGTGAILGTASTHGAVDFVSCLDRFMRPETTPFRSVLLQYHNYLQIPACAPIPSDLEDLRTLVVAALGAPSVTTPAGLAAWITAQLPFVEVSDNQPLSAVPFAVPRMADGWWAVVEIWHSPLLNAAETVRCVARPVVRSSSDIRIVSPRAVWSTTGPAASSLVASEVALLWTEQRATTNLTVTRYDLGWSEQETATLSAVDASGAMTGDAIFLSLGAMDAVEEQIWTVVAERTFPAGLGTRTTMDAVTIEFG